MFFSHPALLPVPKSWILLAHQFHSNPIQLQFKSSPVQMFCLSASIIRSVLGIFPMRDDDDDDDDRAGYSASRLHGNQMFIMAR